MKKNIVAIILVFAMLAGFASCKKLENEGEWVIESKVYVTDEYGAQHDVQSVTKTDGETEYYYYNTDGNKVTVAHKDVVVSTTKIYKPAPTTLTPEQQSLLEAYTDPNAFDELYEENVTMPELSISDEIIADEDIKDVGGVELDADGKPVRNGTDFIEILNSKNYTADFVIKSDYNDTETAIPMYIQQDGDNVYIKTTMPVEGKGAFTAEFIVVDKECYLVIPAMRAYIKIPAEEMGEYVPEDALEHEMASTYVKSGQIEVDGEVYDVDIYDVDGQTIKYFYKDGELKRHEADDGNGGVSIVEYNVIKKGADKSKFKVPTGYIDMTTMMSEGFDINTLA